MTVMSGQMRAAPIGIVEHIGIALRRMPRPIPCLPARVDDPADALAHRPEVHRNVGRVGDQRSMGIEDSAGEIETLLDIDACRRRLERDAHLLGDGHEQVV